MRRKLGMNARSLAKRNNTFLRQQLYSQSRTADKKPMKKSILSRVRNVSFGSKGRRAAVAGCHKCDIGLNRDITSDGIEVRQPVAQPRICKEEPHDDPHHYP